MVRLKYYLLLLPAACLLFTTCGLFEDGLWGNIEDLRPVQSTVTLEGIKITAPPDRTSYLIGDYLDLIGLTVTATYSDGSGEAVEDYTVSNFDSGTLGDKTITVTYQGFTAEFTVMVEYAYTLTININETSLGTILRYPDRLGYALGTEVTLRAVPVDIIKNAFVNWTGMPPEVESNDEITVIINSDLTLTANFRSRDKKTHEETFDVGYHDRSLPGNVRFPAIIEIYALGAGGGGQGGHRSTWPSYEETTGGAGGGGAAAYMRFMAYQQESFFINVGRGGNGGLGKQGTAASLGELGESGTDGGNTEVFWTNDTNILTVAGGRGGGRVTNNECLTGGAGGTMPGRPAVIAPDDWQSNPGSGGGNGRQNDATESRGGTAGTITSGSINLFGGGLGGSYYPPSGAEPGGGGAGNRGYQQRGSPGGHGLVKIIVTWYE